MIVTSTTSPIKHSMSHWLRLFMSFWLDRRSTQKKSEQFPENAKRGITRRETDKTGNSFYLCKERLVWAAVLLYCIYVRHWKDWIGLMVHLTRMMLLITNATSSSSTVCLKLPIMVDLVYLLPLLSCFFLFLLILSFDDKSESLTVSASQHATNTLSFPKRQRETNLVLNLGWYAMFEVMWCGSPSPRVSGAGFWGYQG